MNRHLTNVHRYMGRSGLCSPALLAVALSIFLSACASQETTSARVSDATAAGPRAVVDKLTVSAEIGALPERAVAEAFEDAGPGLERCLREGAQRVEFLAGDIEFFLKIDQQSQVQHIHASRSTIGDRATELCMFGVLRQATWPRPVDGKVGIATGSLSFDMHSGRPPSLWDGGRVLDTVDRLASELGPCKSGHQGPFTATIYVNTDGSVLGASVTPPDEGGEQAVDCLVAKLKSGVFDSPGSWPAKVSFYL